MENIDKISFSHKSMIDDFGRVFFFNKRVFRKINTDQNDYCKELLKSDLLRELLEKKLIPETKISSEFPNEDSLILEHELILETLQHEWSFKMLKDAALMVLEVNEICNKHGYELKDAHTLNILFKSFKPVFIDFGSISKININNKWIAYSEFLNSLFLPLLFWSNNKHYIVRKLLESNFHRMFTIPSQTIEDSSLLNILGLNIDRFHFKINSKIIFTTNKKYNLLIFVSRVLNFFLKKTFRNKKYFFKYILFKDSLTNVFTKLNIKQKIKSLNQPSTISQWKGYHSKFYNNFNQIEISSRFKRLLELIQEHCKITTVIDLAGNEGYFSILLSKTNNFQNIIISDYDENAIDMAYTNIKELKLNNITPILLNFMFTVDLLGTSKRLKSDLVIALAVTHHLILTDKFTLPAIFERMSIFSNKFVMVEFMPLGLWSIEDKKKQVLPNWYTLEWFRNEFECHFEIIVEEKLEENRIVFLGKLI